MGKVLSVYWFAILVIIAGGVFAMVYLFYHQPYDVRELEADILAQKVAACISEKGMLKEELGDFKFDDCHLNFEVEEIWDVTQYYAGVEFFSIGDTDNSLLEISEGNKNFVSSCEIQEDEEYTKLAKCVERRFYSVDDKNNQYLIKILSVVGKGDKNAK